MPHGAARETSAEEIQEREDLTDSIMEKILGLNAKAFESL